MDSRELIKKYLEFFEKKGHKVIPSAPLIPENDPSVLFTTAGMHPLVPYLLGEEHPAGKRLTDNQLCLRTDDIDEVGDPFHHTFFEMLGNWSLGDYWKKEAISMSFKFLTEELGIDPSKLWVTCFEGDKDAPKDVESSEIWENLGIPSKRITFLPKKDNWWGPAGLTGPCGPDSEMFIDLTGVPHGGECRPGDDCGRFVEIWNDVFLQYNKTKEGKFIPLIQKNVDTGMGVERTTAVIQGLTDDYLVKDLWEDIIVSVENLSHKKYADDLKSFRVIADHARASVFVAAEGVLPGNKGQDYILRRLIRRAVRFGKILGIEGAFLEKVAQAVIRNYNKYYPVLGERQNEIIGVINEEEKKFAQTLTKGLKEIEKLKIIGGKDAFDLYQSYGFPLELTEEIARDRGQEIDKNTFEVEFNKHKELSRTASAGMFKGGLADSGEQVTKYHTTTHLLHAALRQILGNSVSQKGSNITAERLRFDFSYSQKLTDYELQKVEDLVNVQIDKKLPVTLKTESLDEAIKEGALHFFAEKYGDQVKVYTISDFSKEVCGGPHVTNTGEIGRVRIIKQEKVGSGVIRIYMSKWI
jgi:alanyl-tRNA synthetase